MKLILTIETPSTVNAEQLKHELMLLSYHRRGLTLVTPEGRHFDVDLTLVAEVQGA